jgi:ABC-2 type transport system ATP-binding protein
MAQSDAIQMASGAAAPAGPAAIAVAHLVKQYKTVRAVDDVSFAIARGSITGLLGGNGAGKTTTIAMIMGLVLPTSGTVEVLGHPMPAESADVLGRMNFESPYVDMPMRLTVRQNLTVSRIGMSKALINAPELLLLDEPTASLDPDTADWVREHLETYRVTRGATILLASHNMFEVERLCDRVIILKRGRIEEDDSPQGIMARYSRDTLEQVFLDVARGTQANPVGVSKGARAASRETLP